MHQTLISNLVIAADDSAFGLDSFKGMLLPMLAIFAIMYFVLIRPQKKEQSRRQQMVDALKKNDRVVTAGGIHGIITAVREGEVTVRIDDARDVKIKVNRSAISAVVTADGDDKNEKKA